MSYLNLCRSCNTDFSSVAAFDRHWTGTHAYGDSKGLKLNPIREDGRRCMDEEEMRAAGLELDARGRWCIVADVERARKTFSQAAMRATYEFVEASGNRSEGWGWE